MTLFDMIGKIIGGAGYVARESGKNYERQLDDWMTLTASMVMTLPYMKKFRVNGTPITK